MELAGQADRQIDRQMDLSVYLPLCKRSWTHEKPYIATGFRRSSHVSPCLHEQRSSLGLRVSGNFWLLEF